MTTGIDVPRERHASLRVLTIPHYRRSRAALGDAPETQTVAAALESSAAQRPYTGASIPGTIVRIVHARRYGDFPALRLYYSIGGGAVHLLWIEHYDEMEP
jgi:hypothetical protein